MKKTGASVTLKCMIADVRREKSERRAMRVKKSLL